jgi:SAM-dependent methyltransferase
VDLCPEMLEQAQRHAALRARLVLGEALHLPFRDSVASLVRCSLALGYIPDLDRAFAEMSRIAESRARVAVSDLHPQALAAGWTRSFKAHGAAYNIEHCSHLPAEILAAARKAGLRLSLEANAHLGAPEYSIFECAGKAHLFDALTRVPALWVAVWEKS